MTCSNCSKRVEVPAICYKSEVFQKGTRKAPVLDKNGGIEIKSVARDDEICQKYSSVGRPERSSVVVDSRISKPIHLTEFEMAVESFI